MEPQTNIPRPRHPGPSASIPLLRNAGLHDAEDSLYWDPLLAQLMSTYTTSNSRAKFPPNGRQSTASSSALSANSHAGEHDTRGPSSNPARCFPTARSARSWRESSDAIDLDAFRKPTPSATVREKDTFNAIMRKILHKQRRGHLIVPKPLLFCLSGVLYANDESEMDNIDFLDQNYINWKTRDSECPNFSQYLVQMEILVTFLKRPRADERKIIDLVKELRGSPTCEWDQSWNQVQQVSMTRRLLWDSLSFDLSIPIIPTGDVTFADKIEDIFEFISPLKTPRSFSHNLHDILEVGLVIQPTTNLNQHLLLTDNAIKIFKIDTNTLTGLAAYQKNTVDTGTEHTGSRNICITQRTLCKRPAFQEGW